MTRLPLASLMALALAGCGGGTGFLQEEQNAKTGMGGRWLLQTPRAPACGLEFRESADGRSGQVVPEGGCPAGYYRGRRWVLEGTSLTIRDDNGDALGQFSQAGERFVGKASNGNALTLTRPVAPPAE